MFHLFLVLLPVITLAENGWLGPSSSTIWAPEDIPLDYGRIASAVQVNDPVKLDGQCNRNHEELRALLVKLVPEPDQLEMLVESLMIFTVQTYTWQFKFIVGEASAKFVTVTATTDATGRVILKGVSVSSTTQTFAQRRFVKVMGDCGFWSCHQTTVVERKPRGITGEEQQFVLEILLRKMLDKAN